jgi:very-short-patch-repair endonuclease
MTRFNRTHTKTARARKLRREATQPEQKLWRHLRGAQMNGFSIRRQHPVGPYVLDFYCPAAKLAIELDGRHHGIESNRRHDADRTIYLGKNAIRVLRFWNTEIYENSDGVLDAIARALTPTRPALPVDLPLLGGGNPISDR